ncbi:hypothetical protein LguiB_023565 [Lonicera macranthoides]
MQKASKRRKMRKKRMRRTKRRSKAQRGASLLCITHLLKSVSAFSRKRAPRRASMPPTTPAILPRDIRSVKNLAGPKICMQADPWDHVEIPALSGILPSQSRPVIN